MSGSTHPNEEAERDEPRAVLDLVEQPEEDGARPRREDAQVEHPLRPEPVDVLAEVGRHQEDGELKDAEDEAVLGGRGALLLGLCRVERGLQTHAYRLTGEGRGGKIFAHFNG